MDFFRGIAVGIGWLTSSLAGIGAILYVCGYLINRAQSNLLGIDVIVVFHHEQFVQEGGKFFVTVGIELANIFLNLLLLTAVLASPIFLSVLLVCLVKKKNIKEFWTQQRDHYLRYSEPWGWLWRSAAYLTLVSLLLFSSEDPHRFDDPLEISNLLYMTQENSKHSESIKRIRTALEGGEVKKLQGYFADCVVIWLKAAVLLLLAWYIAFQWKYRLFAVAPFVIIFGINTVLLPMLYGVLQKVIRFPVITLISSSELLTKSPSKFFLLNKTDAAFVIWDAAGKKVVWIPMGEVKAAAISQVEPLFKPSTKEQSSEKLGDVHGVR